MLTLEMPTSPSKNQLKAVLFTLLSPNDCNHIVEGLYFPALFQF
jgi:hypothetical protein